VQFREGILFAHVPEGGPSDQLASVLAQREPASGEPGRKRPPVLSQVAVLVTDLQHSGRLWSDLPAEEYFELINQVWLTVDPIFRRHHGTHGKHPGDGLVGYFFPQPDGSHLWNALQAAQEAKAAMRAISTEWQARKGWRTELYLNTGLDEGQQWLGTLQPAGQVEFTMQSAALNRALRIAGFARSGAIWATKNLVARLTPSQRDRLHFGVRQAADDFVASVFSTVEHLSDPARPLSEQLREIARLPITEIVGLSATATDVPGVAGRGPV
jgi:class 3 adenylate cyclase